MHVLKKEPLREFYKKERGDYNFTDVSRLSNAIYDNLFSQFSFVERNVHTFYSIVQNKEVDMSKFNKQLLKQTKNLITSVTVYNPKIKLIHSLINEETEFVLDKFNIPVPSKIIPFEVDKIDIVLVPLLVCDKKGNRIGYGKGLYDSFLVNCNKNCIKIGLSFFEPIEGVIETEEHDIPLDYCVTPTSIFSFK